MEESTIDKFATNQFFYEGLLKRKMLGKIRD